MHVQPYLFFDGRCEEALEYYRAAIKITDVRLLRYKDNPEPQQPGMIPPGSENKVMHSSFRLGETEIMASDGRCGGTPMFEGFSLVVLVKSEAEARQIFEPLAADGQVQLPLTKTFFSPCFGMLLDKFGVAWMVIVQH